MSANADRPGRAAQRRNLLLVLALWGAASLVSIGLHGPMPLYSTRTLGVAWEMWSRGDFLVPYLNGEPYSHKVPLLYWLIHAGWAVGGVGLMWPRILMVAISSAFLAATAFLAAALFPQRPATARCAPWILAGMPVLFLFALQFMFEVLLGLSVVLAFLAVAPALRDQRPRWGWFGVAVGVGLLTKGPVMLLHVAFPLLCAPWWSRYARRDRWRWFRGALLGVGIGSAMLAAWLVPALLFGGERYRSEVLWMQTGGRVVDSFDHARPIWWYLPVLLGLLFPWLYWSAWWRGLARLHRDIEPGTRFLLAWLIPTLLCFALVSGKQFYYLIPWLAGAAVLIARALDDAAPVAPRARVSWGLLPFALLLLGAAGAWIYVGHIGSPGGLANRWFSAFVEAPIGYALGIALLGALLLAPLHGPAAAAAPRLAAASLLAFTLGHAAFSASLWPYFDLTPVAQLIHQAQAENRTVATLDKYEDEYHFLGRLREPLLQLQDAQAPAWAVAHPDDVLVTRPSRHAARPNAQPIFSAEFRERIVQVWRAGDWLEAQKEGD